MSYCIVEWVLLSQIHYLHYLCVEYPSKASSPRFPEIFLGTWSQAKNSSIWCKAKSIACSRLFSGQKTKNNVLAPDSMIYNLFSFNPPKGFCYGFWYANHVSLAHLRWHRSALRLRPGLTARYENDRVRCCRSKVSWVVHSLKHNHERTLGTRLTRSRSLRKRQHSLSISDMRDKYFDHKQ